MSVLCDAIIYLCTWFSRPLCSSADDIPTNYSIRAGLVEIEKGVQTLERRQLHLIAAMFRQCHEMKLISEVGGDRLL